MPLPNSSTINTYNGAGKVNSQNIPPTFSTGVGNVDWDNPSLATCVSDVAGLTQTADRFLARITLAATTGALVLNNWFAVWANATGTTPVLAKTGTGVFTITLPTAVSDEYDASFGVNNSITTNLVAATVTAEGSTACFTNASASGNVITINSFNVSGSANNLVGTVIFVRAR